MDDTVAAAADPHQALLATIQQQAQELQQLRNENADLRQALAFRSAEVPTVSTSTPRFSGEPTKLREFLDALTVYFAFRPTQLSHDKTKVGYLISALSGPALAWATPLVSSNDPVLSDYPAFVNWFKQMFSHPG
ncbi:protein LDOC1-like [Pleurodeles waltl]|uniref:protein LDOC1-like n=1 Tax=Pleurodeles waltl TaxID=8319 RepID=UPI003709792E